MHLTLGSWLKDSTDLSIYAHHMQETDTLTWLLGVDTMPLCLMTKAGPIVRDMEGGGMNIYEQ